MLDWLFGLAPSAPTVLFLTAAFFLPGLLVLLPLKPGWPAAIALSPAVTLLMYLAGSFLAAAVGLPWNIATAALAALPLVVAAWLAGRWFAFGKPLWPEGLDRPATLAVAAGVAVGAGVTCLAILRGIGDPATASQGWDPIFHLNALRWIQESGEATPWSIAPIFGAGTATYYPAGWHGAVALVPGSVSEAANLSSIVIGGLIWPAGLAFLATAVLPRHPAAWALTPLIAASFVSFPFSQLLRSGQWPNGLATALVPATLAVAVLLLRRLTSAGRAETPAREKILLAAVLLALLGGCAAAHPSALFATAVALLPFCGRPLPAAAGAGRAAPSSADARGCGGGGSACHGGMVGAGQLTAAGGCHGLPPGRAGRGPGFPVPCLLRPSPIPGPLPARPGRFQRSRGAAGDSWRGGGRFCPGSEAARRRLAGLRGTLRARRGTGKRAALADRRLVQGHPADRAVHRHDGEPAGGPGHCCGDRRRGTGPVRPAAAGKHIRKVARSRHPVHRGRGRGYGGALRRFRELPVGGTRGGGRTELFCLEQAGNRRAVQRGTGLHREVGCHAACRCGGDRGSVQRRNVLLCADGTARRLHPAGCAHRRQRGQGTAPHRLQPAGNRPGDL
ncbi:hypothetical protein ARGLB_080_01455 [Arthrobacter globiformis NBRC 12137]|uniref:Uncharacterized protein n=1 Tax=Arthrobacter globiformis (strain ATCC 8010 / DSM 20124 / JCM 1332 / NBRC 12137 / NCIMB 8907 / NRRL B-2979 / 168) TaxID=1077972 RepID=H0QQH9_ARTG1|nr:hypothetical protein ARGLB_080_01455 [Arthrobacter globiformis NBRC 12137]